MATTLQPLSATNRDQSLDILRGFALAGVLLVFCYWKPAANEFSKTFNIVNKKISVDFRWLSIPFKLNHFLCSEPKPYSYSSSSFFCFHGLLLRVFGKELKQIIQFTPKKSTIQKMLRLKN